MKAFPSDPWAIAAAVTDPELPMLTLEELGVLRSIVDDRGRLVVSIRPTYSGCPAMDAMRDDLEAALVEAGYRNVEIRILLSPPWSSNDITPEGRRKLAAAGIAPPARLERPHLDGPVPLTLNRVAPVVACTRCGSLNTVELSRFGATACRSLWRCDACDEPFEHVKEI